MLGVVTSIIAVLLVFILGRVTGSVKAGEKLKMQVEAYTEQIRDSEQRAETAEKKAELAEKVAETVTQAVKDRSDGQVASLSEIKDAVKVQNPLDVAQRLKEQAEEMKSR